MRLIASTRTLEIPSDVTIEVKARKVRVKGPRGTFQEESDEAKGKAASPSERSGSGGGGGPIARRAEGRGRVQRSLVSPSLAEFLSCAFSNCGSGPSLLHAAMAARCSLERMQARIDRSK